MPRRILISNDDGHESPGLWALARACRSLDCDVTVVVPNKNQSAVGGSLTLRQELNWVRIEGAARPRRRCLARQRLPRLRRHRRPQRRARRGARPARFRHQPGARTSATTSPPAALSAPPSRATTAASPPSPSPTRWTPAPKGSTGTPPSASLPSSAARRLKAACPSPIFLNVNIPLVPFEEIKGILVTRVARRGYFHLEVQGESKGFLTRGPFEPTPLDPPPGHRHLGDLAQVRQRQPPPGQLHRPPRHRRPRRALQPPPGTNSG